MTISQEIDVYTSRNAGLMNKGPGRVRSPRSTTLAVLDALGFGLAAKPRKVN